MEINLWKILVILAVIGFGPLLVRLTLKVRREVLEE
jgi:hypothetical protein